MRLLWLLMILGAAAHGFTPKKKPAPPPPASPLERYVSEAEARSAELPAATPGAIWQAGSRLADAARDMRASQVDDVLTILVVENASAVAKGTTKTQRTSSSKNSVGALAGIRKATGPLANLAGMSGDTQLDGQGSTTRDIVIAAARRVRWQAA